MSWGKGVFSDELGNLKLTDALGLNILCDDGITRKCHEIVGSNKWPWMAIINEQDPNSKAGYFVHLLSLAAQIIGKPLPDKDTMEAFNRTMRVKFTIDEDGRFDHPPKPRSRLFIPKFGRK